MWHKSRFLTACYCRLRRSSASFRGRNRAPKLLPSPIENTWKFRWLGIKFGVSLILVRIRLGLLSVFGVVLLWMGSGTGLLSAWRITCRQNPPSESLEQCESSRFFVMIPRHAAVVVSARLSWCRLHSAVSALPDRWKFADFRHSPRAPNLGRRRRREPVLLARMLAARLGQWRRHVANRKLRRPILDGDVARALPASPGPGPCSIFAYRASQT